MTHDLVWTGFDAFDDHDYNPSRDVARGARRASPASARCACLPVRYEAAARWVRGRFEWTPPRLLVHLGLAASRDRICLERRARNVPGHRVDEEHRQTEAPLGNHVDALETSLAIERLVDQLGPALRRSNLPGVRPSDDAGDYVCNFLYLHSLHRARLAREEGADTRVLFIHVPPCNPDEALEIGRTLARYLRTFES